MNIDTEKAERAGENVNFIRQDGKLILIIDEGQEIGPSSSGKMMGVASTGGFTAVPGGMKLNLYLGKKS